MNGGARPTLPEKELLPAITTSSKTARVIASGSTAKAFTAGKQQHRAGSCMACLREFVRVRMQGQNSSFARPRRRAFRSLARREERCDLYDRPRFWRQRGSRK